MLTFNCVLCALLACVGMGAGGTAIGAAESASPTGETLWTGGSDCTMSVTVALRACPVGDGVTENPDGEGFAVFYFPVDFGEGDLRTDIKVWISHFQPNTTYGVKYENIFAAGGDDPVAITTNAWGRGYYNTNDIQNRTQDPMVIIYIDEDNNFEYTPGEERACGGNNCAF